MSSIENTVPISLFNRGLINDARLLAEATKRMSHFDPSTVISQKEVDQEFGFSPADYDDVEEIEFE